MNPHTDIETPKWEYGHFAQSLIGYLNGFQEALVGVLVTLNPDDKEGNLAFRASDYGLTDDEKKFRKKSAQQWRAQQFGEDVPATEQEAKLVESEAVNNDDVVS